MTVHAEIVTRSPAEELRSRLDEPQVVAALTTLLDHADVLALVAVALDGFLSRGDVIADTLAEAVGELRAAATAGDGPAAGVDVPGLATSVARLSGPLVAATPALQALLEQVSEPSTIETATALGASLGAARAAAARGDVPPAGPVALLRALRDPDITRGLGFVLEVARAFGRRLG